MRISDRSSDGCSSDLSSGRWPETRFPTRPAAARATRTSPPRPARSAARSRATRSRTGSRKAPPTASPCAWRTATCAPCSRPTWRASARVLTYASAVAAHRCAERRPITEKARLMAGLSFVDLLPAAGGEIAAGLQPTLQRHYRIGLQALLALPDGDADLLAFRQALEALGPARAELDANILAILAGHYIEHLVMLEPLPVSGFKLSPTH